MREDSVNAFFALVQGGLWEHDVQLMQYGDIDYNEIMRLAEEQSVVGLVTAGFEHVKDIKVPKEIVLQFIGQTLQLEQRNNAMNAFIGDTVEKLREADICSLLVKGQGIAQCYERPQWRTPGDIDFLLSSDNYNKAKAFFCTLSSGCKPERRYSKEWGLNIGSWYVEIHGTLRTGLSSRVDKIVDSVQNDIFCCGKVRSWQDGNITVFLPEANNDVFLVFTHFIKHFYKEGGVSLRQLCDWCRLLWKHKDTINVVLLEKRLRKACLLSEWRAFSTIAVSNLGMSKNMMPLYSDDIKWKMKAKKIISQILSGTEWRRVHDTLRVGGIFPLTTIRFVFGILFGLNWLKIKERIFCPI